MFITASLVYMIMNCSYIHLWSNQQFHLLHLIECQKNRKAETLPNWDAQLVDRNTRARWQDTNLCRLGRAAFLHITSSQTRTHYREHFLPAAIITHLSIFLFLWLRRQWRAYVAPVTKRKTLAPCHADLITLLIMLICGCLQGHAQHDFHKVSCLRQTQWL